MPTIYRIEHSDGTKQTGMDKVLAGQVTFDGKKGGKTMAGEFQALLIGREIKPLPHPLEWSSLRAAKETYLSASLKGILLRVERRICLECGDIFDAPKVTFSGAAGCLPAMLMAIGTFGFYRFGLGKTVGGSVPIALIVLFGSCLAIDLLGLLYVRLRFSKRQIQISQPDCPACGGDQSVSVTSAAGKRLEIGNQGKWVNVSIAGKA